MDQVTAVEEVVMSRNMARMMASFSSGVLTPLILCRLEMAARKCLFLFLKAWISPIISFGSTSRNARRVLSSCLFHLSTLIQYC